MSVVVNSNLLDQTKIVNKSKNSEIKYAALIGYIDLERNSIEILTSIHLSRIDKEELQITEDDLNHLKSLNYLLPFPLKVVGILFYLDEEISEYSLKKIAENLTGIKQLVTIASSINNRISFYAISQTEPKKITVDEKELPFDKSISIIHTTEFESSMEILNDFKSLKEDLFNSLKINWDKVLFNKEPNLILDVIVKEKRSLDRIIEINLPSDIRKFGTQTPNGKFFLAIDLHMNIYPFQGIKSLKISDLKDLFYKSLSQDLIVKLQRSYFDTESQKLILPEKIPIKFGELEFNAYFSEKNPSKFELDLLKRLLINAQVFKTIGNSIQARLLLRGFREYFFCFKDEEMIKKIDTLLEEMS